MAAAFLIMLREGFEASLIVAIVFAYLRKLGRLDLAVPVWLGVAAASGIAIATGIVVHLTVGDLRGSARLVTFAVISIVAVVVLTWMVFWMRKASAGIKSELHHRVDRALSTDRVAIGVAMVAFLAVLREGIEAAIFLIAASTSTGGWDVLVGGLAGIALASGLGVAVYFGGKRLPMKTLFNVTGVIVILFAAGLAAKSVQFLQAAHVLGIMRDNVYDLTRYGWLTNKTEVGRFLAALFGWDPRPSIEQVLAWVLYVVPVTVLFLRPQRHPDAKATPETASPADQPAAQDTAAPQVSPSAVTTNRG
ncbi:MAG: FTR1 family protein [Acidimicrobiia bacterium]|nr:FTR1 family protein [Acidimicrobiia bacterium]